MGQGKGVQMNLDLILRIVELILLILSIALFLIDESNEIDMLNLKHNTSYMQGMDAMCMSCSVFVIIYLIVLGMQLIKGEEQDQKFMGWLAVLGAILLIATGIVVCIKTDHNDNVLISGIMAIVGGAALIVDALKDFGVF